MTLDFFSAVLNSFKDPIVIVDTDHIIRFINRAGAEHYSKWGGSDLVGKSILDCHNETSRQIIIDILASMVNGEEERVISENERRRVYMRAIRDGNGKLIGYYERYEYRNSNDHGYN